LIRRLLEERPDEYEKLPSQTYKELVEAQIKHDREKQAKIDQVKQEAMENLRRLQEISGLAPTDF